MAKRGASEIVQNLARQRGRGSQGPLVWLEQIDQRPGARISHLPISRELAQAWVTRTGAPFRPHQALALSALRRGDPFALLGGGSAARQSLHLLASELLLGEPSASGLLLLPDAATLRLHLEELRSLAAELPRPLAVVPIDAQTPARTAAHTDLALTTPDILHRRLLRHHDRAWQPFWARLRALLLAEAHCYTGAAAAHLAGLLLRSTRLVPGGDPPYLAATLAQVQGASEALSSLSGLQWRVVPVDDTPRQVTALAIWQAEADAAREAASLARILQREGYQVQIVTSEIELTLLETLHGVDTGQIGLSTLPQPADIHIFAGYPGSTAALQQALASGIHLCLLVLGQTPAERTLARLPASLFNDPPPTWMPAPINAYVSAQHLLCAASERPLATAEVAAWHADDMIARLQRHNQLVRLPDDTAAWQPLPAVGDPYVGFDLGAVGSAAITLADPQGTPLGRLDPAAFDRWGAPGAVLPAWRGGYAIIARDDEAGSLTLQPDPRRRRTFPLRKCTVDLRDQRESRTLRGRPLGWGRVLIEEEVYGYRETQPDCPPTEQTLAATLATRWTAPALWVTLPMRLKASGQLIGWSLAAALPLRLLTSATDLVPAYDAGLGRLYLVDAQPGGNGLAAWLYTNLETALPLAYDIALDCRNDALLEPVARADMDWLLTLLAGEVAPADTGPRAAAPRDRPPPIEPPPNLLDIPVRLEPAPVLPPEPAPAPPPEPAPAPPPEPAPARRQRQRSSKAASQPPGPAADKGEPAGEAKPRRKRPPKPKTPAPDADPPATQRPAPAGHEPEERPDARARGVGAGRAAPPPPAPPPPAPDPEPAPAPADRPDPDALLARLQQQRRQMELANRQPKSATPRRARPQVSPRFQVDDRVFCLPYGEGIVRACNQDGDQQVLAIDFADYGRKHIDPAVNEVRRIDYADD